MAQILVSFILAVVLAACSPGGNEQGKAKPVTLHLFTWSDYTEETAVKQFEERFGVKVATDTFGSNEELLVKLQGGASGYDVVVPSDHMVSILIKQWLLAELDPPKIHNLAHVYNQLLVSGEVALAHGWSGTILRLAAERPSIKYVSPRVGGTIWQDNLCVLTSSKHKDEAMAYINSLLEPKTAALITSKVKYASASEEARLFVPKEIAQNPAVYPPASVVARLEWIKDVGEAIKLYDRAWTELKVR